MAHAAEATEPADPYSGSNVRWQVPGLRLEAAHRWRRVEVAVFERAAGEAVWRSDWHRLAMSETDLARATMRAEGRRTLEGPLRRGDIMLHPAGVTTLSQQSAARYVQVLLDPALFAPAAFAVDGGRAPDLDVAAAFRDPLCAEILHALAREAGSGPDARLLVDGLATALAVQVLRRCGPSPPPPAAPRPRGLSRERLRRVLDHVEAHLGEELALADLAAVACLSPWHFSRCFAEAMGLGPHRYVQQRRVARAQEMLRRPEAPPLAAVAHALGFADQSHFTRAFRRETGATPGRWRAALA